MEKRSFLLLLIFIVLLGASCGGEEATQLPPTPTPIPTIDPYGAVEHLVEPGDPVYFPEQSAYDCNTGRYTPVDSAAVIGLGCNRWDSNLIEIPQNELKDTYFPYLDIIEQQMGEDDTWYFARYYTYATEDATPLMLASYGMEIDFEMEGQGDLLILVGDPSDFEPGVWTVEGVQVWEDANEDVGAETILYADEGNSGDGYETLLFDQGLGDDPDLAWARLSPEYPGVVEFAIKKSILEMDLEDEVFSWWGWASQVVLEPGKFDYVDSYAEGEMYQIENTCRWVYNAPPFDLPNICAYAKPTPAPGPKEKESCCYSPQGTCTCPCPCPPATSCLGPCSP
ncbi:MAG: hypothetical protein PVF83_00090 [Anaerolineales bacterium]|jgi:hypothetical protein